MAALSLALLLALARERPAFVDRIEGDRAILIEASRTRVVPLKRLERRPAEGTMVRGGAPDVLSTERARRAHRKQTEAIPWRPE